MRGRKKYLAMHAPTQYSMQSLLQKLINTASDAKELATSLGQSGIDYAQGLFRGIPLISSITALSPPQLERDEKHYLLIPCPNHSHGYTMFTKRVIPEGYGATNALPKTRIFHLPDQSGKEILEREFIAHALKNTEISDNSEFADRLDRLADEIDRETAKISGGLLLIGGVVALINPLIGVGIAAKALFPSVGSLASKAGFNFVSDKLRKNKQSSEQILIAKEAEKDLKRLKPEIYHNPILQSIDALITNPQSDYDPLLSDKNWIAEYACHRYFEITLDGIHHTYRDDLAKKQPCNLSLTAQHWIKHLIELHQQAS
jgi:hypothetical protein